MELNPTAGLLEDLIETLEDGAKGFTQAADLLSDGENTQQIAEEMRRFAEERRQFSVELRNLASGMGHEITEEGSAGGAIHRAWMSVKDTLTGDDPHAILAAAERGEDHAVAEYEDALGRQDLPEKVHDVIATQATAIRAAHDKVKQLRDSYAS